MSLSPLPSYETHKCYYDKDPKINGGTTNLNGTYFFNADLTIGGSAIVKGTATLVLFGTAHLKISGSPTIQLTAPKDHPQLPPPLSSVSGLMTDLLIYDPEPYDKKGVNVTGGSDSYFNGTVYVPNTPVTYSGNSSVGTPDPGCFQVIAYAVTFSGNTELDNSKCKSDGAPRLKSSMCGWCSDEKARSARRRGAGILPCRRVFVHIDVRHLRARSLCNHYAVIADARECWCSGGNDQLLYRCRNQKRVTH